MAWETIKYACGHEENVQMYGPHEQRRRRKAAMEKGLCTACRAKEARELWPGLSGSDKQVALAADIKSRRMCDLEMEIYKFKNNENRRRVTRAVLKAAIEKDDARWWIDRRNTPDRDLLIELFNEVRDQIM